MRVGSPPELGTAIAYASSGHRPVHANVMERINAVGVSNPGAAMNNVIQFPSRRPEACPICEERPRGRQERLLIEYIPFKEGVCDDCLLAFGNT